jgi:hypothetical protein
MEVLDTPLVHRLEGPMKLLRIVHGRCYMQEIGNIFPCLQSLKKTCQGSTVVLHIENLYPAMPSPNREVGPSPSKLENLEKISIPGPD